MVAALVWTTVSIETIIVNYNAGEVLQRCLKALLASNEQTKITLIDNASSDGSAENISNLYGHHQGIEFLFNATNLGFAAAVNAVARRSSAQWLLILNPDCILRTDALTRLRGALESDGQAALAGPMVLDDSGRVQRATARRFPGPLKSFMTASGLWRLGKWFPGFIGVEIDVATLGNDAEICEAVSGACMLVRRSALAELDYLDEGYAMHCEDIDLMYRLAANGWHCLFVPRAVVVHIQGESSRSRPSWVHFQKHRSLARFFKKFQAGSTSAPIRALVYAGIWLRFMVLWPLVLIRN